ncbi:2TM domain-containing protein [Methanofollis formosanus]|uniref:2TM domain-containing protein n=1 Tax=Methanofollis formosanus TaxID=299308 RepID=A0A8G1A2X4_9EURY|nr:2TM domain-containing protein [Methanofollis formosanus]QYZ79404.1 2TM domain-containing protein [Methanofollis formosanus]
MEDESYERARKRVRELRGFYEHLGIYLVINLLLFAINAITSPGAWWFYWVTLFWGVGLLFHALGTFLGGRFLGPEWEERKMREYVEKEKKRERKG